MEGPFFSCMSTYPQLSPTSNQIQLFKELAEQPISLIRELLQMRLMLKALQLIQLNEPGPSFQGKASFSKFQKEAKEVQLLAIPLIRCH